MPAGSRISPPSGSVPVAGGNGSVTVAAAAGCAWTASSGASWLTVTSGSSGSGNGTVNYTASANPGAARSAVLTIAGQTFTVSQPSGAATARPPRPSRFPPPAVPRSATVTAAAGCAWTAVSGVSWITVTNGAGTGTGSLEFVVAVNSGAARGGTITVAGQTITVNQSAAACTYSLNPTSRSTTNILLMTALYRSGRQAEALRAYQDYRGRLATDLGLEPGEEIRQLELSVATGVLSTPPPSTDARAVRTYRLLERIGEGAYAVVYRASQPSVDRVVAIKVIRAELADRPEFVRRFEAEAHLVARLEHPHIVPLYDFWREPGSAYLVMRYFRGGTLEQQLSDGCLEPGEAAALATQVGSALAAAHRAGVVHRDVKPGNIFLDGEGNYFLGDFGIADAPVPTGHASPAAGSSDTGPPVDVYGLGVTVCEALTGQQAFPINGAPLPDGLGPVLTKATAADASARHATVEDLVAECIDVLTGARTSGGRTGPRHGAAEVRNPYKGLRAFQEADAPDFYGRVRLVGRMIELMAGATPASRFLTVVGPSGSGKSSAVRAGLIPALRAGAVDGSQRWFLTSMTPGAHPFEELEAALARVAVEPIGQLAELMASGSARHRAWREAGAGRRHRGRRGGRRSVRGAVHHVSRRGGAPVVPRRPRRGGDRSDGPVAGRGHPASRLLRSPTADRGAGSSPGGGLGRRDAAHAERAGGGDRRARRRGRCRRSSPGSSPQVAADVRDQPGGLPLLQYVLTELFDRSGSGVMTMEDYRQVGGVSGALSTARRGTVLPTRDGEQQAATRRLFTRLVALGDSADTRRRVRASELGSAPGDDPGDRPLRPGPAVVVRPRPVEPRAHDRGGPRRTAAGVAATARLARRRPREPAPPPGAHDTSRRMGGVGLRRWRALSGRSPRRRGAMG